MNHTALEVQSPSVDMLMHDFSINKGDLERKLAELTGRTMTTPSATES